MTLGNFLDRFPTTVLPTALLLALLAGCSGITTEAARPGPSSGATASPSATAPASPLPSLPRTADDLPGVPVYEDPAGYKPFTGPASDEFGAASVMQAYLGATRLLTSTCFDPEGVMAVTPPARLTDAIGRAMTPRARGLWQPLVAKIEAMDGTEEEFEDVFALVCWSILGATDEHVPGVVPREPRVRDQGFGGGTTAVVTDRGLALDLRFPMKGQILTSDPAGQPWRTEVRKDVRLTMVRTDGRWFIDGWEVDRVVEKPVLDTAR